MRGDPGAASPDREGPIENTFQAMVEGISRFDGVEMDLRLTSDHELVLFHDRILPPLLHQKIGGSLYPEHHTADELETVGISRLASILEDARFRDTWVELPVLNSLEFKLPYPASRVAGGWFSRRGHREHLAKMYSILRPMLKDSSIPDHNVVVTAFSPHLMKARTQSACESLPSAILRPTVQPWGGPFMERFWAMPAYALHPFRRMVSKNRRDGSPFLPMALHYLQPFSRRIVLGSPIGFFGKALRRFEGQRKEVPVHIFPTPLDVEWRLRDIGASAISDHDPLYRPLDDDGRARWTQPATYPIDELMEANLRSCHGEDAKEKRNLAIKEKTPWNEISTGERRKIIEGWRKRWRWRRDLDMLMEEVSGNQLPWEAVRVTGHRGCGESHRPFSLPPSLLASGV